MTTKDKIIIALIAIWVLVSIFMVAYSDYKNSQQNKVDIRDVVYVLQFVESDNGHNLEHGLDEVGILGIRPIMVDEVNRVLGKDLYKYSCRYNDDKSREMCLIFLSSQVKWYVGKYGRLPTEYMIASSWNTGSIVSPINTKYIKRYISCKKRLI